jgi:hypothetical protein
MIALNKNTVYLLILTLLLVSSCKSKVRFDKLQRNEDCIYFNSGDNSKKPFTGIAYETFKNSIREDSNTISSTVSFKNGIPEGKYVDYASKEDIFQSGKYIPITKITELRIFFPFIKRISICKSDYKLPEPEFSITVVSARPDLDSINLSSKKNIVINFLKRGKWLKDEEIKLIDTIGVWVGEF